jgi:hypothetical protein
MARQLLYFARGAMLCKRFIGRLHFLAEINGPFLCSVSTLEHPGACSAKSSSLITNCILMIISMATRTMRFSRLKLTSVLKRITSFGIDVVAYGLQMVRVNAFPVTT